MKLVEILTLKTLVQINNYYMHITSLRLFAHKLAHATAMDDDHEVHSLPYINTKTPSYWNLARRETSLNCSNK
jgi:hypothetical protein